MDVFGLRQPEIVAWLETNEHEDDDEPPSAA